MCEWVGGWVPPLSLCLTLPTHPSIQFPAQVITKDDESLIRDVRELVAIKSISALSEHKGDVRKACQWFADRLISGGYFPDARVQETGNGGHPVVTATRRCSDPDAPTITVYGHVDVQPVDPIEEWQNDPFELTRDEIAVNGIAASDGDTEIVFLGRGATDDKGNVLAALHATSHPNPKWPGDRPGWKYGDEKEDVALLFPDFFANASEWKIAVVSGTADAAVPFVGTQRWLECLGRPVKTDWKDWFLNSDVAGAIKQFDRIDFVTVKGCGHTIPTYCPEAGFAILDNWLNDTWPATSKGQVWNSSRAGGARRRRGREL